MPTCPGRPSRRGEPCPKGVTGAWAARSGLIAEAAGGTLFLDEIETLSLAAQAKPLRFVEDRTYYVLGSSRLRQADVWIIASTNIDLRQKTREGAFRADLFYRLTAFTVNLPPLRERRADIPLLVDYFWSRCAVEPGRERCGLSPRAMDILCTYVWPGNIRELQNAVRQLVAVSNGKTIQAEDLPIPLPSWAPAQAQEGISLRQARTQVVVQFERAYLRDLLLAHHGNVTRAARAVQVERRAFGRLIKKHGLSKR